jgi:hypothetical protein
LIFNVIKKGDKKMMADRCWTAKLAITHKAHMIDEIEDFVILYI